MIIVLLSIKCSSQTVNIKDKDGTRTNGAYYKDVDNELNQFEGTYQLITNNGNDELTIVFKKFTNQYNTKFYQDVLAGEIRFKKNGVTYFDNLNKLNLNLPNKYLHDICGNSLIENDTRPVCEDCSANQFRARLIFFGRNNICGGYVILQKIIENGQEKIKASFYHDCNEYYPGQSENPNPYLVAGDYILTRIN